MTKEEREKYKELTKTLPKVLKEWSISELEEIVDSCLEHFYKIVQLS